MSYYYCRFEHERDYTLVEAPLGIEAAEKYVARWTDQKVTEKVVFVRSSIEGGRVHGKDVAVFSVSTVTKTKSYLKAQEVHNYDPAAAERKERAELARLMTKYGVA